MQKKVFLQLCLFCEDWEPLVLLLKKNPKNPQKKDHPGLKTTLQCKKTLQMQQENSMDLVLPSFLWGRKTLRLLQAFFQLPGCFKSSGRVILCHIA